MEFDGTEYSLEKFKMTGEKNKKRTVNCPFAEFKYWDAMVSADGDYECNCSQRPNGPGEFGGSGDRPLCDVSDYLSCEWFQKFKPSYVSNIGEFHKLGNLEEQGFNLPVVKSYGGKLLSIKPRNRKPTVYSRGPANNLYVYG